MSRGKRIALRVVLALGAVLGIAGFLVYTHLLKKEPEADFATDEEHFKYASVGVEEPQGVPFWIWRVLPAICPDKLPGKPTGAIDAQAAYGSFGFLFEEGHDSPIGMPKRTIGFPRLGINCAMCHTAAVESAPGAKPSIVVGAPSNTLDLEGYLRFLFACTADPRFDGANVVAEIEKVHELGAVEKLIYKMVVVQQMKKAVGKQKEELAFIDKIPDYGPGRTASFNPAKMMILGLPDDGTNDTTDIMSLWNWDARKGISLHWGGEQTSLHEVFLNSGIGNGATEKTIELENLARMERFVQKLAPAKYPFPIDGALASRGKPIFDQSCANCHALGADKTGKVIPIDEEGTDRKRLEAFTPETAERFNGLKLKKWSYQGFRKTNGYKAEPLDGIWVRAPYLHNGAVANMNDLLTPPASRPKRYFRGSRAFDQANLGFVSTGPGGFAFDTTLSGNSNSGHDYATALPPDDKKALIEYLKTL